MTDAGTVARVNVRSFFREPVTVGLLVVLPLLAIELYSQTFLAFHAQSIGVPWLVEHPDAGPGALGYMTGGLFAAATLAGVIGLFQIISARRTDGRLMLCGSSRLAVLSGRFLTIVGLAVLIANVTFVWLTLRLDVRAPLVAFGVLVLVGLLYGLVGMLVGALLARELEGSLLLIAFVDVDNVFASGIVESDSVLGAALPLYHPHALFESAVFGGPLAVERLAATAGYVLVLFVLVLVTYDRLTLAGRGS